MKTSQFFAVLTIVAILFAVVTAAANADPLHGQVIKFNQRPMIGTVINDQRYYGHDEYSTIFGIRGDAASTPWAFESGPIPEEGIYMADDFADKDHRPVVHVRWWGSYMNAAGLENRVKQFLISFEHDVPAVIDDLTGQVIIPSHPDFYNPDNMHQVVYLDPDGDLTPNEGTFTEKFVVSPTVPPLEDIYMYNAELKMPFEQQPDTVYWLKIVALVDQEKDGSIRWGWHNRDYTKMNPLASTEPEVKPGEHIDGFLHGPVNIPIWHFQDDAVRGSLVRVSFTDEQWGYGLQYVEQEDGAWTPQSYLPFVDGPPEIGSYSKDLAFQLFTVPEPSSLLLVGIGLIGLVGMARRRR